MAKAPARSRQNEPLTSRLRVTLASVESGIPLATMTSFVATSGLLLKGVHEVVIPERTWKHRRERKQALSRDESDKLARLIRIFDYAVKVFDGPDRARIWLEEPKRRFDGRSPLAVLTTETGGRLVEEFLVQIEYGMFA